MIRLKSLLTEEEQKYYISKPEYGLESYYENVDDIDLDATKIYWRDCAGVTFEMSRNDKQKLEKVSEKLLKFTSLPQDEGTVNNSTGEPEKLTLKKCVLGLNDSKWKFYIEDGKKPSKAYVAIIIE